MGVKRELEEGESGEKRKRGGREARRKESGRDEWVEGVTIEKQKVKTERSEYSEHETEK